MEADRLNQDMPKRFLWKYHLEEPLRLQEKKKNHTSLSPSQECEVKGSGAGVGKELHP